MQSSRTLASFNCLKRVRFVMKIWEPEEGWVFFWTLVLADQILRTVDIKNIVDIYKLILYET